MKTHTTFLRTMGPAALGLLLVLSLTGCPSIFGGGDSGGDDPTESETVSIATGNLSSDLSAAGFSEAQIEAITGGAIGSLSDGELTESDDREQVLTTMVSGGQGALAGSSFTDEQRLSAIETIVGSAVGSLSDSGTSASSSIRASQTSDILSAIVRVSVSGIGNAGFTADDLRRQAAGSSTGGAVRNLGRGGVSSDVAVSTVRSIAESGVRAMGSGGYLAADVGDTVRFLTRQALANADDTGIVGFEIDVEVRSLVREVSRGVTSNLGKSGIVSRESAGEALRGVSRGATGALRDIVVGSDQVDTIVNDLTDEVSRGVSESLANLKRDVLDLDIQASVRTVVRGTTEGLNEIREDARFADQVNEETFRRLVRGVTSGATTAVREAGIDTDDLERELTNSIRQEISELGKDDPTLADLDNEIEELVREGTEQADDEDSSEEPEDEEPEDEEPTDEEPTDDTDNEAPSDNTGDGDSLTEAERNGLMVQGITSLEEGRVNDALSEFQTVYDSDQDFIPGALAYSLVDMATVLTDSQMVSFARDDLGIVDYPTRVADVLDPSTWMEDVVDPTSDSFVLFPRIANQTDRDGDGTVDAGERMAQMADNMIAASATNNSFVDLFAGKMGDKLDDLQNRISGINASDGFTITPTMVYSTEDEAIFEGWPQDPDSGELMEFTIGTAELNVVLASGRFVQFLNQWGQAIDVAVNYDYYLFDSEDKFRLIFDQTEIPEGGYFYNFPALGPLAENSFLESRADAETHLAAAGDAFVTMLDTIAGAMEDVTDRSVGSSFAITSESIEQFLFADDPDTTLTDPTAFLNDVATVFRNLSNDVTASFNAGGGTPAYLPVPSVALDNAGPEEYFRTYADNWPTSSDGVFTDGVLTFDFGTLFGTSIGGISGIFELDSTNREPVLYKYANPTSVERLTTLDEGVTTADLESAATTASFTEATSFSADSNDASSIYFIRIPDATLGMAPNAITQADLNQFNTDVNMNWRSYYSTQFGYIEYDVFEGHELFARFNPDDSDKVEVFIRVPAQLAGHLYEGKGTEFSAYEWALSRGGTLREFTSLGSFWWGLMTDLNVPGAGGEGDYVGGNSMATATGIPSGSLVEVTAVSGDVLWYSVDVVPGQDYVISLDDWDEGLFYRTDVYFQAYNSSGQQLYSEDDGSVHVTGPAGGVLYLTIDGTEWNESGPVGLAVFEGAF